MLAHGILGSMHENQLRLERSNLQLAAVIMVAALAVGGCAEGSGNPEMTARADIGLVLQDKTHCSGGAAVRGADSN